mgnify:CR=1 FL=1
MISYQEFKTVQELVEFWALAPASCERLIWDEELGDYAEVLGVFRGIPVYPMSIDNEGEYIVADTIRWLFDAEKAGLI